METIFTLIITLMIIPMVFLFLSFAENQIKVQKKQRNQSQERQAIHQFIDQELRSVSSLQVRGKQLIAKRSNGDAIQIRWQYNRLIRSLKKADETYFRGTTIIATGILQCTWTQESNGIRMVVYFVSDLNQQPDLMETMIYAKK